MKLLFIRSQNRLRNPTAEAIFLEYKGLEVESAGLDREAEMPLESEAIRVGRYYFCNGKIASP